MLGVTFDTNLIEEVLDEDKARQKGIVHLRIHEAIRDGRIKGFVSRVYFAHDAILKNERIDKLCGDVEICLPSRGRDCGPLKFMQMAKIPLDGYHERTLTLMHKFGVQCLDIQRKFWPIVDSPLPLYKVPDDYDKRANAMREFIENELHCGFARFRQYLRSSVGAEGDDMTLLFRLKEIDYSIGGFNKAFAEAGDGDSLAAHYGYGIDLFCTSDEASHAGKNSVFSVENQQELKKCFGVEIVSIVQLDQILQNT